MRVTHIKIGRSERLFYLKTLPCRKPARTDEPFEGGGKTSAGLIAGILLGVIVVICIVIILLVLSLQRSAI